MNAVDNLEYMFEARFESLNLLNRRLKEDLGQKNSNANGLLLVHSICISLYTRFAHTTKLIVFFAEHIRNLEHLQRQNSASMDEMEKDYLGQLQTFEDENEKLKLSIIEGNELLSQCQRALTLASQKSASLAVKLFLTYMLYATCLTLFRIS
jgi:hypothetical protein